jgi:transcriptional regulator with XRE-family HTH domain
MPRKGGWEPTGFGDALRRLREGAKLSQEHLAQQAGCTVTTVSRLERGIVEPAWPLVLALAKALGVTCEAFQQAEGAAEPPAEKPGPGRPRKAQTAEPAAEPSGQKPKRTRRKG